MVLPVTWREVCWCKRSPPWVLTRSSCSIEVHAQLKWASTVTARPQTERLDQLCVPGIAVGAGGAFAGGVKRLAPIGFTLFSVVETEGAVVVVVVVVDGLVESLPLQYLRDIYGPALL